MLEIENLSRFLALVEEYLHPVKDGEVTSQINGMSLAPMYSLRQLRRIERRKAKHKLDLKYFRTYGEEELK